MPDGNEALINFRVTEGYIIMEMVTSQITLRHGGMVACVFNDSMPMPKVQIKDKNKGTSFFGIF
jgi:type IV secretory pathway VirB9-like protein